MLKHIGISTTIIIITLCGLLTSYILSEEFFFKDIPSGQSDRPGIFSQVSSNTCGSAGSLWSCATVAESEWATIFNIPVAVYGVFYYALLSLLAFIFMFSPADLRGETAVFFFWIAAAGMITDIVLLYISLSKIHAVCPLCIATYVMSALCFCIACVYLFKKKINPLRIIRCIKNIYIQGGIKYIAGSIMITGLILLISFGAAYGADRHLTKTKTLYYLEKKKEVILEVIKKFKEEEPITLNIPETMVLGDPEAPVTISEFSDFLCPYCAKAAALMDEIISDNPSKVRVVFHNYPLDKTCNSYMKNEMHRGACLLAKGAVCAARQGAFETYQRMVFSAHLRAVSNRTMEQIAIYSGLELSEFQACLESQETADIIVEQIQDAKRFDTNSTPTIYINGRRYRGKLVKELLQVIVDMEYNSVMGKK